MTLPAERVESWGWSEADEKEVVESWGWATGETGGAQTVYGAAALAATGSLAAAGRGTHYGAVSLQASGAVAVSGICNPAFGAAHLAAGSALQATGTINGVKGAYGERIQTLDPVAWWRLGDASGAPQDTSGNARHMTAASGLTYGVSGALTPSEANDAISAAGAGYASIADNSALEWDYNGNFTIVLWAKWSTDQQNILICKWAAATAYPYYVRTETGGKVIWSRYDLTHSPVITSQRGSLNDNTWHFIGLSKTGGAGGTMTMVIDGQVDTEISDTTDTTTTNSATTRLFSRQDSAGYLTGAMDEVALFDSGLSTAVMQELYALGKGVVGGLQKHFRPNTNPMTRVLSRYHN